MRGMSQTNVPAASTLEILSRSEAETIALGRQLGELLQPGDIVLLFAPLGAGKTHLTKGIASAFGVDESDVSSPTFVLINEYESDRAHRRMPIFHVDLYRIETPDELATVGLDDVMTGDGIAVVEWAERAANWFPREHLEISIEHAGENERRLRLIPHGERYHVVVKRVRGDKV
jgi:tRNA threonylcarbamoyladenosine biosynthesis protein TsaE